MSATDDPALPRRGNVVPLRRELRASLEALSSLLGAPRVTSLESAFGPAPQLAAGWPCGCTASGTRSALTAIFCRRHHGG